MVSIEVARLEADKLWDEYKWEINRYMQMYTYKKSIYSNSVYILDEREIMWEWCWIITFPRLILLLWMCFR
jgi:hypothetical protein